MRGIMRGTCAVTLAFLAFRLFSFAQNDVPNFRVESASAFVWGDDNYSSAVSSSIHDPVTGNEIHKLSHAGVEVSSQAGFERIGYGAAGELLSFTTTIGNNTESDLSVRRGGASIDGHVAFPLTVVPTNKGLKRRERTQVWELTKMTCFLSGFLAHENYFSPNNSSRVFTVPPNSALKVSFITQDPRKYPFLCSMEGCYPTGTMRFYVTINATDYVFVWLGRSSVNCGK
jgi:hypothetical protein